MKTMRTSKLPPFYTQITGSLPRPRVVLDLIARRHEFAPDRFTQIMDDLVRYAIRLQGMAGLDVVSDGKWGRTPFPGEFFRRVGGFGPVRNLTGQDDGTLHEVVVKRMNPTGSVFKADADFLVNNTARLTKFAIPSPFFIAHRYWREDMSKVAYPTLRHFMDHLVEILCVEVRSLVAAGIDIIQIDDAVIAYLRDGPPVPMAESAIRDDHITREWNFETDFPQVVATINRLADAAAGKAEIHLHCQRRQARGRSTVVGSYKSLLPRLKGVRIDRINLEFACRGVDTVDDLALLPPEIDVGMGVLDVRSGTIQTVEEIQSLARIGTRFLPPSRIALNPDRGFSSEGDDPPTLDDVYEKLRRLVTAAKALRKRVVEKPC